MEVGDIVIMENSLKYLRRNLVFPRKKNVDRPGMRFYLKFIAINLSTGMFLAGNILHLIINIKSTYLYNKKIIFKFFCVQDVLFFYYIPFLLILLNLLF